MSKPGSGLYGLPVFDGSGLPSWDAAKVRDVRLRVLGYARGVEDGRLLLQACGLLPDPLSQATRQVKGLNHLTKEIA